QCQSHSHNQNATTSTSGGTFGDKGVEPLARCSQCERWRTAFHHFPHPHQQQGLVQASPASANGTANANAAAAPLHGRPRRISKPRHRAALTANATQQHQRQHYQHQTNAAVPFVSFSPRSPSRNSPAATTTTATTTTTTTTTSRKRR